MIELTFSQLVRDNELLKSSLSSYPKLDLKILSNITVNQLVPILEYTLRNEGLNAYVETGEYDNIIQESTRLKTSTIPVIIWELCNLKEGFVYELEYEDDRFYNKFLHKVQEEILIVFNNLSSSGMVIFNTFSHFVFSADSIRQTKFESFVNQLNVFLYEKAPPNVLLINIDKPLIKISKESAIDWRGFYTSKSLYSVKYFKEYASFIKPAVRSKYGKSRKALIFDCDNTLWKGILGEDGIEKIELSEKDKNGKYFKEIHLLALSLLKKGIILGICSKNNSNDVEEVFEKRNDFLIRKDDLIVSKVNWNDKASNLQEMAKELNIGIDSFVFVDDSEFEINLINDKLPEVNTILVPQKLYDYPRLLLSCTDLFFSLNTTTEDTHRIKMYKQNIERTVAIGVMGNIEDYLASLEIKLNIALNDEKSLERIAQLTQKTNQFNLTTKRYGNGEIKHFFESSQYDILSFTVDDKFGSFGITGLCILRYENDNAILDTLLMSCRVLGRNIEKAFLFEIVKFCKGKRLKSIRASFIKTHKNGQVELFYESNGFSILKSEIDKKEYEINLNDLYLSNPITYINVLWKTE
jgi:FkbH-like protein